MNTEFDKEKIITFLRSGLFVLSGLLLIAVGFYYVPKTVTTMSKMKSQKELPIYCVDSADKKVSLSFDAAWAEGRLMELKKY